MTSTTKSALQTTMRVSAVSITWNVILSIFKLAVGIFAHSRAMISDAVHSASDVFSTVVVIIGVKMASKDSDKEHPYGHERMECVAAIVLAVMLFITGLAIGSSGLTAIFQKTYTEYVTPGIIALIAAAVSIAVKEGMYHYTHYHAKMINSGAMMADAWHHRSDALSSVGSFIGILGARLGFPIFDSAASVLICVMIIKAAYDIFADAINKMTDTSCDDNQIAQISEIITAQADVLNIDRLRTRIFGDKIYVDVEICVDGDYPLRKAHAIAESVHDAIECSIPNVKHCMVHVNPTNP